MPGPRVSTEYQRRGIECAILENEHLRVEILTGKGGDVTEIRDKRTDVNVLFEAPHEWRPLGDGPAGAPDATFAYLDHYPGGWQDVLPAAGGPADVAGAPLALHGETPIRSWSVESATATDEAAKLTISLTLSRYPFHVERTLSLPAGASRLTVDERVENLGEVAVDYSWLQHLALGRPLVGPEARLEVPCERILVDPDETNPNARLPAGAEFEWPICRFDGGGESGAAAESERTVDLREFPPKDERVHDLVALAGLEEGSYTVSNPAIDLGATIRFPAETYEYLWYWQAFGGFTDSPFFGREYVAGLEPCTSIPNAGLERAIENDTAETLEPGETQAVSLSVETHAADPS
jgi:galactose mutarotase-like enzyme